METLHGIRFVPFARVRGTLLGLDVRWIGVLADALHTPNVRQRNAASRLLTRLLPRLKRADAGLLDTESQYNLCLKLRASLPKQARR